MGNTFGIWASGCRNYKNRQTPYCHLTCIIVYWLLHLFSFLDSAFFGYLKCQEVHKGSHVQPKMYYYSDIYLIIVNTDHILYRYVYDEQITEGAGLCVYNRLLLERRKPTEISRD